MVSPRESYSSVHCDSEVASSSQVTGSLSPMNSFNHLFGAKVAAGGAETTAVTGGETDTGGVKINRPRKMKPVLFDIESVVGSVFSCDLEAASGGGVV